MVVYSLNSSSSQDIHYIAKQAKRNRISLNVTGLTGAEYGVSTFALENGLPISGEVVSPKNISISNSHQGLWTYNYHSIINIQRVFTDRAPQQSTLVEFDLIKTSSSICVTCTFLEGNSATDCVAVVHQQISQLNSSGLINIESSHKFTRSGDTAYGCIEGVNLEQYQVGVIGGRRSTAMTHHTRMCQYSLICILKLNSLYFSFSF